MKHTTYLVQARTGQFVSEQLFDEELLVFYLKNRIELIKNNEQEIEIFLVSNFGEVYHCTLINNNKLILDIGNKELMSL